MDAERRFLSTSLDATLALAEAIGRTAESGLVIALCGELGSGKTAFVRGLARGLDAEGPVASPTFTLMHAYPGRLELRHYDAWMEGRERAFLLDGGVEELGRSGVSAIEWADRLEDLLPRPFLRVRLSHRGEEERGIELAVVGDGPELAARIRALAPVEGLAEAP